MSEKLSIETSPQGAIVPVRAHVGARKNAIVGARDGMLRVAVSEPPEKGKANKAIADVLSQALGVAKSSVVLLSGATSSRKRFLIEGTDADTVAQVLSPLAG